MHLLLSSAKSYSIAPVFGYNSRHNVWHFTVIHKKCYKNPDYPFSKQGLIHGIRGLLLNLQQDKR